MPAQFWVATDEAGQTDPDLQHLLELEENDDSAKLSAKISKLSADDKERLKSAALDLSRQQNHPKQLVANALHSTLITATRGDCSPIVKR